MPFNSLMLTCLSNKTSYGEAGCNITIVPERSESILLFVIDEQSNPRSNIRQTLEMSRAETLCDCIYFYLKGEQRTLCFVELKGSDLEHAVNQVINTKQKFLQALEKTNRVHRNPPQHFRWKAYIRLCGNAPAKVKQYIKALDQHFDLSDVARDPDIGKFLRRSVA